MVLDRLNVAKLFELQRILDDRIEGAKTLGAEELLKKKVLALFVELGELANETRCFKFWSEKPPSARARILDEYVDGLHFVLSLGLMINCEDRVEASYSDNDVDLTKLFINVYQVIADFQSAHQSNYQLLMSHYLALGYGLGFTNEEIEAGYVLKNDVNHQRQEAGY